MSMTELQRREIEVFFQFYKLCVKCGKNKLMHKKEKHEFKE